MQSVIGQLDYVITSLGLDDFEYHDLVVNLSKRLNTTPRQVMRGILGLSLVFLLIFLIKFADQILLFIVGVLYPGYETIKVRNSTFGFEKGARLWLLYWVCFGLLSFGHSLLRVVLKEIPFLHLLECGVLIWLYHKKTMGVDIINNRVFAPLLKKYGKELDKQIDQVKETLQKKVN